MANMFNEDGTYNKTEWKAGDKITAAKLNKIELSLEAINNNEIDRHVEADSRLDILEERMNNTPDNEKMNALKDMVKDNKDAVDSAVYGINQKIESLESINADSRLDALEEVNAGSRLGALESVNADSRLDALEGVNADSRLDALEGVNADSRLDALEGVNADSRIDTLEQQNYLQEEMIQDLKEQNNFITPESFGVIGDGITDDTANLQLMFDSLTTETDFNRVPNNSVNIIFPYGNYLISEPLVIKGTVNVDFSCSKLTAKNVMDYMLTFESSEMIPNLKIKNLIIDGNGLARTGLQIQDLYRGYFEDIVVFNCSEQQVKADKTGGMSNNLEFEINRGLLFGGIIEGLENANGLVMNTTDCMINHLYTIDLKHHIVNNSGVNFYHQCHGWNMNQSIINGGSHFLIGWDCNLNQCYSDTFQTAFIFTGDARCLITNHECFVNRGFYDTGVLGDIYLFKQRDIVKGNEVKFIGGRFDSNGLNAKISDVFNCMFEFNGCINNYTSDEYVVTNKKSIEKPSIVGEIDVWGWQCNKQNQRHVSLQLGGTITQNVASAKGTINVCKMPIGTYNQYYLTAIPVMVEEQNTWNTCVVVGKIAADGMLYIKLNGLTFTPTNQIEVHINTDYFITY